MDIHKHLILIRNEDKTEQIEFCKYDKNKWHVKYNNNNKIYTYHFKNVVWHKNPKFTFPNTHIVYENNQPITGIKSILDFGTHKRLIFNSGFSKSYPKSSITIEESCLSNAKANDCFNYLKTLSNYVSDSIDGELSYLNKQYNALKTISPRSTLSSFLLKTSLSLRKNKPMANIIFPFGFYRSQKSATENALTEHISIIEGPPGTGKTQTILNIIANAVINNKTVAVVSNNNSATANVLERLNKYGLDFIAAYLGNKCRNKIEYNQSLIIVRTIWNY